jgi:hypothetical protein
MNKFSNLLVLAVLSLATPLGAQPLSSPREVKAQAPTRKTSQGNSDRFVSNFQRDVVKGCLANSPSNSKSSRGYCNCYAASFAQRFAPQDLFEIARLSAESPRNSRLIALMMAPEIRACRRANP